MPRDESRFRDFDERMRKLRGEPVDGASDPGASDAGGAKFGSGIQAGIELVAGVVGGGLIGWLLDRWLETWPVLFIALFFLGAAAGMLNAYRHIRRASEAPPERSS